MNSRIQSIFEKAANSGSYFDAIKKFEEYLKKNPKLEEDVLFLNRLGFLYDHYAMQLSKTKRLEYEKKAVTLYNKILKIKPNTASAIWGIGRVYWHRKSKKSVAYAKKAYNIERKAGNAGLYAQTIALCYESIGNLKLAEKWLERGVKESKNDLGVYLNLLIFYDLHKIKNKNIARYKKRLGALYKKQPSSWKQSKFGKYVKSMSTF